MAKFINQGPSYGGFETDAQAIARERDYAKMLQQQALQPMNGQMVSGIYVAPSITQYLSKAFDQYLSGKMQHTADQRETDTKARYNDALAKGLENYVNLRNGAPASMSDAALSAEQDRTGGPVQYTPETKADPRRAAIQAVTSGLPALQQIGMTDLQSLGKAQMTPKDFLGLSGFDPKSRIAAAQSLDPRMLAPENKEHVVNNQIVTGNPDTGYKPAGYFGEKFGPTQVINGEAVQFEGQSGKAHQVAHRPANVKLSLSQNGESEFMKGVGKDTAELVSNARKGKQAAQQLNYAADRLEDLDRQGVLSGPAANIGVFVGTLAQSMGVPVDSKKLANSQEYAATLGQQVAKVLTAGSGVGRSMTDEDRRAFMSQFPQLVNTPEGRAKIVSMMRNASAQDIDYADRVQSNLKATYPEAARLFDIAPSNLNFPSQSVPTVPAQQVPMSLDDYLKQNRR